MTSKEAELENTKFLLEAAEQARNDVRNSLLESGENLKIVNEKARENEKLLIAGNKQLQTQNTELTAK